MVRLPQTRCSNRIVKKVMVDPIKYSLFRTSLLFINHEKSVFDERVQKGLQKC